jgi:hypothetical protein
VHLIGFTIETGGGYITDLIGRSPLSSQKSTSDSSAIKEEEEEDIFIFL